MNALTRVTTFDVLALPRPKGDEWLAAQSDSAYQERMDALRNSLRHYLATGDPPRP